jgi:hypothetical protein
MNMGFSHEQKENGSNMGFSHEQQKGGSNILRYEVTKTRRDGILDKRFKDIRRIIRCMNKEQQ